MSITTAIEPKCGKCGQPLGSSFLYNGRAGFHHECFPVSPAQKQIADLQRQLSEAVQGRDEMERELAIEKTRSHGDWSNQRENDALTIRFYEMKERAEKAERERDAAQANAFDAAVAHGNARRHADAAEAEVARLVRAGAGMANLLYNVALTSFGTPELRTSMKQAQTAWDGARTALQQGEPK
ncbi:hypothetical protein [Rhizobiales bacterium 3FA27D7]|jgi:hypothetical protein|uniref:hypothetical protein n=1 Tax=Mesorhizobium sp. 2RAF21 TaxID=3232995 RepID=UPI0010F86745